MVVRRIFTIKGTPRVALNRFWNNGSFAMSRPEPVRQEDDLFAISRDLPLITPLPASRSPSPSSPPSSLSQSSVNRSSAAVSPSCPDQKSISHRKDPPSSPPKRNQLGKQDSRQPYPESIPNLVPTRPQADGGPKSAVGFASPTYTTANPSPGIPESAPRAPRAFGKRARKASGKPSPRSPNHKSVRRASPSVQTRFSPGFAIPYDKGSSYAGDIARLNGEHILSDTWFNRFSLLIDLHGPTIAGADQQSQSNAKQSKALQLISTSSSRAAEYTTCYLVRYGSSRTTALLRVVEPTFTDYSGV